MEFALVFMETAPYFVNFGLAGSASVCGGADQYLNFGDGQQVTVIGDYPTAPVPAVGLVTV